MTVQLEKLNTKAFEERGFTAAIYPIGACESHGDHMPFGTDGITAHLLGRLTAERLKSTVLLPPSFFGMSEHYRHKPMAISLTSDTQIRVITDVLNSLRLAGIHRVLILNGHDGNAACAEVAARTVKVEHPEMNIAVFDWWSCIAAVTDKSLFKVWDGWGHAGEIETSIGLSLFPDLMDASQARGMVPKVDRFIKEIWLFEELTRYGATGGPSKGTKAKGDTVAKAVVNYLVEYMSRFERQGLAYDPVDQVDPDPKPNSAKRVSPARPASGASAKQSRIRTR